VDKARISAGIVRGWGYYSPKIESSFDFDPIMLGYELEK
jgi:hypothetical protein